MIRIWKNNASAARSPVSIAVNSSGDWIPNNVAFPANRLFAQTVTATAVTLFVEGIGKGTTDGLIKAEFSPLGDQHWIPDEVKVSVIGLDADIDADSNGSINDADDPIEAVAPGKIIPIGDGDFDNDGIIDYNDNQIGKGAFTELTLEIPTPLDLKKIKLKITYGGTRGHSA